MVSLSLRTKLTATACLLVSGLLSCLGIAALHFFSGEFRNLIGHQQFATVSVLAEDLDQQLTYARQLIVTTAASLPAEIVDDPGRAQDFLDQHLGIGTTRFFDNGIFLFSPTGRLVAEWPFKPDRRGRDYSFRDYIRLTVASGGPIISEPYRSSQTHHHPAVNFTAPLFDRQGHLAGVLAGSMDLTKNNFLSALARTPIGESGYYYLFNTDRLMIMHPDPTRLLQHDVPPGANRLFDLAVTGFEGSGETVNSRGVPMLVAFKHLANTDWILAANLPQAEAFAPLRRARNLTLAGVFAALLLGVPILWLNTHRQLRPLLQLTGQVRSLTSLPEPRQPLTVRSRDEIGTLTEAFNQLLGEVSEQTAISQERLDFLQTLLDSIPVPIYYKGLDGRYLGCNAAFELSLGVSRADLLGKTVADIIPAAEAALHLRVDGELLPQTESIVRSFEQSLRLVDGERHDLVFFKSGFRNGLGDAAGLIGTMIDITAHKKMEAALAEQREFSSNLLQNSAVPCFVLDPDHRVLNWSRACEELTGLAANEVIGTDRHWKAFYDHPRPCLADLIISGNLEQTLDLFAYFGNSPLMPEGLQAEGWFPQVGGKTRYLYFEAAPIRNQQGELIAAIETLQDLTSLKQAEQALRESEESYRSLIERSPDAILVHQEGQVVFGNRVAADLFAASTPQDLSGRWVADLIHPDFRDLAEERLDQVMDLNEEKILRLDGEAIDVEVSSAPVFYRGRRSVQTVLRDITERKELQEKIWRQANFDPLTGIPNRLLFHDRLGQAIERAAREGYEVALLFIDLDRFKAVNDLLGHEAGDCLLREVAARLTREVRGTDTVARMGGDEFTLILPFVVEPPHVTIVARRILESLSRPFDLPGGEGRISGSIGIARFPEDGRDIPTLLRNADAAMYRAKQGGRHGFCYHGMKRINQSPSPREPLDHS